MIIEASLSEMEKIIGNMQWQDYKEFLIETSSKHQRFSDALFFCHSFPQKPEKKFPTRNRYSRFSRAECYNALVYEMLSNAIMYATNNSKLQVTLKEGVEGRVISIQSPATQFDIQEQLRTLTRIKKRFIHRGNGLSRAINTEFLVSYENKGSITNILGREDGSYKISNALLKRNYTDIFFDKWYSFLSPGD